MSLEKWDPVERLEENTNPNGDGGVLSREMKPFCIPVPLPWAATGGECGIDP